MKTLNDCLYYHEDGPPTIDVYLGDCLTILPLLPKVDLVVTDPPYGLDEKLFQGGSRNLNWAMTKYKGETWDEVPDQGVFDAIFTISKDQIIWGLNYFNLPPTRGILCWDKKQSAPNFSQVEIAWTSFDNPAKLFSKSFQFDKLHPTQKPTVLMKWAIQQCKYWDTPLTVLDPFGGSGTTAVACKELKKDCTLIEINEKYCEIAKKRLLNTIVPFL